MFYARKEPTKDEVILKYEPNAAARLKDVCLYKDEECTNLVFRVPWHHQGKPIKKTKTIMYNCMRYPIKWVEDLPLTKVIFRSVKYPDGENEILALFPNEKWSGIGYTINSYAHIGQHGPADYRHIMSISKSAKPEEYKELTEELESIGYNLLIRQRAKITYK